MKKLLIACFLVLGLMVAGNASADITYDITVGNAALTGYTGTYGTVLVHLSDSTHATITFTGGTGLSPSSTPVFYLFGDSSAIDVNVNAATWTISVITPTALNNTFDLGTFSSGGSGNVNGFGTFNQTINDTDGNKDSAEEVVFTLTNTSSTWVDASSVLTANSNSAFVAAHIFVSTGQASDDNLTTGFASNGGAMEVPEPSVLLLLGAGLIGLGGLRRRFKK
jgi:PEP-CTERM motif